MESVPGKALELKVSARDLRGRSLLLAVSGGLDSVCLLDFFARNREAFGVSRLAVAHVDHSLRGEASEGDAEFVRELSKAYSLDFHLAKLGPELKNSGGNLEARAREMRYRELHTFRQDFGYDLLLTAHHLDDQAETLFMRLARGTSLLGLRGIRELRGDSVFRPFLKCTRVELLAYAKNRGLAWREDESNSDGKFRRNFVRHSVLTALGGDFSKTLSRLSTLAARTLPKILDAADKEFSSCELPEEAWPFPEKFSPSDHTLALKTATLEPALKRLGPGGEELFRLWLASKGFEVPIGEARSPIFPLPKRRLDLKALLLERSLGTLWIFDKRRYREIGNLYFSASPLGALAKWRYRENGDFYLPFAAGGTPRKLSRWMQERGIPETVRNRLPLLASGHEILEVAGLELKGNRGKKGPYGDTKT